MEGNYVNIGTKHEILLFSLFTFHFDSLLHYSLELLNKKREAARKIALKKQIQESQLFIEELTGISGVTGETLECDEDDEECIAISEGSDFVRKWNYHNSAKGKQR